MDRHILVVIPYYKSQATLKRAVDSILRQTYKDFTLLIINDGDKQSPRDFIKPNRKIYFFDMETNRGRYFVDAVAVAANPYPFYLPTDADDYSDPNRLKVLKNIQESKQADAVFSFQCVVSRSGRKILEKYPLLRRPLTPEMKHIAHHSGLYRTEALRAIGSYHPDFRVGYDTLLVNLLKMKYRCECARLFLHTRYIVDNSLTTSPSTGFNSRHRKLATKRLNYLYKKCLADPDNIQDIIRESIDKETLKEVEKEAKKLKEILNGSHDTHRETPKTIKANPRQRVGQMPGIV